jgi:hypothetical protein
MNTLYTQPSSPTHYGSRRVVVTRWCELTPGDAIVLLGLEGKSPDNGNGRSHLRRRVPHMTAAGRLCGPQHVPRAPTAAKHFLLLGPHDRPEEEA